MSIVCDHDCTYTHKAYIHRAVEVFPITGMHTFVAYKEKHEDTFGYWLCSHCHKTFGSEDAVRPQHREECPLDEGLKKGFSQLIYILGPNEDGTYFPYQNIEQIKKLAKEKYIATTRKSRKSYSMPEGLESIKTHFHLKPSESEKHSRRSISMSSMPNFECFKNSLKSFSPTFKPESSDGSPLADLRLHYLFLGDDEKSPPCTAIKSHHKQKANSKKDDKDN